MKAFYPGIVLALAGTLFPFAPVRSRGAIRGSKGAVGRTMPYVPRQPRVPSQNHRIPLLLLRRPIPPKHPRAASSLERPNCGLSFGGIGRAQRTAGTKPCGGARDTKVKQIPSQS